MKRSFAGNIKFGGNHTVMLLTVINDKYTIAKTLFILYSDVIFMYFSSVSPYTCMDI